MRKRKSNIKNEQEIMKKFKINPCSVNLTLYNPALWIYNYTIDLMRKHNKQLKSKSILRIMNGYANSKKPLIPISYINQNDLYKVIRRDKFREFTNVESIITHNFAYVDTKEQLKKHVKFIYKQLRLFEFRQTEIFKQIKINCDGLFDTFMFLSYIDNLREEMLVPNLNKEPVTKEIEDYINKSTSDANEPVIEKMQIDNISETIFNHNKKDIINLKRCRTREEFVECTNVKELAKIRFNKLNLKNIGKANKNVLIDIIISNTWKQLSEMVVPEQIIQLNGPEAEQMQSYLQSDTNVAQINCESLLHEYITNRMQQLKFDVNDTELIRRLSAKYKNYDKCLVPISYLANSTILNIFPNLFTFVRFTNILKYYQNHYQSLYDEVILQNSTVIECIKHQLLTIYQKLMDNLDLNQIETDHKILINCKYLFNHSETSIVEDGDTAHEIIECFKKIMEPMGSRKNPVNLYNSSNSKIVPSSQQTRHRAKMLNQVQTKINNNNLETDENESDSSLESIVTVIYCDPEELNDDQQTIVVPEYTQQKGLEGSNETLINLELEMSKIHNDPIEAIPRETSMEKQPNLMQHESVDDLSSRTQPREVTAESIADTKNMENMQTEIREENAATSSSVEFVSNKISNIILIEDSPTNSQRIAGILESPLVNSSGILDISYAKVVTESNNILKMRKQNCKTKISKNPELEIPVMRNTYRPLPVKTKTIK